MPEDLLTLQQDFQAVLKTTKNSLYFYYYIRMNAEGIHNVRSCSLIVNVYKLLIMTICTSMNGILYYCFESWHVFYILCST